MLLLLFSQQTRGQAVFRIGEALPQTSGENPFFTLVLRNDAVFSSSDSVSRVVHIYSGTNRVVSFHVLITQNDAALKQQIIETKVLDSVLVPFFPKQIDSSLLRNYQVNVISTNQIDRESPIEVSRIFGIPGVIKLKEKLKSDSLLRAKSKGPLFSVSGTLTTTAQSSNTSYAAQTLPENYIRQSADITLNIAGVPLTSSFLLSSEGGVTSNHINNLGFSVDFNRLKQAILKEVAMRESKKRDSLLLVGADAYKKDQADRQLLLEKIDSLRNKLSNKEYQDQLAADSLAMLPISDTTTLDYKHKISRKRLEAGRSDRKLLEEFEHTFKQLEKARKKRELLTAIESEDIKLSRELNSRGYNPLKKAAIKSVRRIDLGNFIPNYSALVLSGTNITGINLELNPGLIYLAAAAGQQKVYGLPPLLLNKRNIGAAKIGVGNPDKFLVAVNVLSGEVADALPGSEPVSGSERYNLAAGLALSYHYSPLFNTEFEYARSVSKFSSQPKPVFSETFAKENFGNAASFLRLFGATPDNKTRYSSELRYVEPYFSSFGTPNLRKDHFRYEFTLNQALVKNILSGGVTFIHDNDNVSNTKINTSTQNRLTLNLRVKYKKYPYLVISYSPARQKVYATGNGILYASSMRFVTVSSGYNQRIKAGNSFTSATYSYFSSNITGGEGTNTSINQLMVSNTTFFQQVNRNLKTSCSGYRYSGNDSTQGFRVEAGLDKTNKEASFTYEFGAAYQWDKRIETRYIIYTELRAALRYRITFSARIEEHLISRFNREITDQAQVGRLIITKSF